MGRKKMNPALKKSDAKKSKKRHKRLKGEDAAKFLADERASNKGTKPLFNTRPPREALDVPTGWGTAFTDSGVNVRIEVEHRGNIKYLRYNDKRISPASISPENQERLREALKSSTTVKGMEFGNGGLTDAVVEDIIDFLQQNRVLAGLWFLTARFTDAGVSSLLKALTHNTTLTVLDINYRVGDDFIPHLVNLIQETPDIKSIWSEGMTPAWKPELQTRLEVRKKGTEDASFYNIVTGEPYGNYPVRAVVGIVPEQPDVSETQSAAAAAPQEVP